MKTYLRLLSFARPFGKFIPKYFLFALLAVIFGLFNFTLVIPLLNVLFGSVDLHAAQTVPPFSFSIDFAKSFFHYFFNHLVLTEGKYGALKMVCAIIFFSFLFSNLFRYLAQKVLTSMRTHLVLRLREQVFNKLTDLHLGFFQAQRKGDLMSNLSNDIQEVENSIISSVQVIFREPLTLVGFFVLLFSMSAKLTFFTLLILPVSGFMIAEISKRLRRDAHNSQHLLGTILSIIEETISGVRIIKAFNTQNFIRKKFSKENEEYARILKSVVNKRELSSPLSEFMGATVVTAILLYGGQLVLGNESSLQPSEFITYIILYSQVLVPAKSISSAIANIQRGLVSGERILRIIDEPSIIEDKIDAVEIDDFHSSIEFKNVYFAYNNYNDDYVLKNINLEISKGRTIALVGQSGAGKSTLADMIPRFYDITAGSLLIDGVSIKDIKMNSLRKLLGIVTQETILFNDTVYNNIAFGMEEPDEQKVIDAAKVANAHDFIIQLENGYHTNIGDRGNRLSGGQRQRLSIARAVFKNPPILILDEATSALDTESEVLVQDALYKLMENRTSIVIAHRLSTILRADEIMVMYKGEIIERGTHQELLAANGNYRKFYEMQTFI